MPSERPAMIAQSAAARDWQPRAGALVTDSAELFRLLGLDPAQLPAALAASRDFPLKVPRSYVRRMRVGDPHDPLLLQVPAPGVELEPVAGFSADPLEEPAFVPVAGIPDTLHGLLFVMSTG